MTGAGMRSAAVVNAEIRALWASGSLSPEDERQYQRLVVEWAAADQAERRVRARQQLAA
ncbi:hypothetical protein [Streptomyces sp. NPDC059828]|uniref:hypothetical protein n=1 Tax=Streptomyces sp. NPDC059828 TaxID=3346965 RepID=UPI00364A9DC1